MNWGMTVDKQKVGAKKGAKFSKPRPDMGRDGKKAARLGWKQGSAERRPYLGGNPNRRIRSRSGQCRALGSFGQSWGRRRRKAFSKERGKQKGKGASDELFTPHVGDLYGKGIGLLEDDLASRGAVDGDVKEHVPRSKEGKEGKEGKEDVSLAWSEKHARPDNSRHGG
jgi:hypothetical protein